MPADRAVPRKRAERRSRKNVHGRLRGIFQTFEAADRAVRDAEIAEDSGEQHDGGKEPRNGGRQEGGRRDQKIERQQKEVAEEDLISSIYPIYNTSIQD